MPEAARCASPASPMLGQNRRWGLSAKRGCGNKKRRGARLWRVLKQCSCAARAVTSCCSGKQEAAGVGGKGRPDVAVAEW